jgi:hypothetical protein
MKNLMDREIDLMYIKFNVIVFIIGDNFVCLFIKV